MSLIRVRGHRRRTNKIITWIRPHYRRNYRRRNFFIAKSNVFVAGGLSKKRGPYLLVGYRKGLTKIKSSIGLEGHKIIGSFKPSKSTKVTVERNLTFNRTNIGLRHKRNKLKYLVYR